MNRRRNLLLLCSLLVGGLVLMAWAWRPFQVVGHSMEPSLVEGDWLFINREMPAHDDLVVFHEPDTGKVAVKRVAGIPGERVQLVDGDLYLDGQIRHRRFSSVEQMVPMVIATGESVSSSMRLSSKGFQREGEHHWKLEDSGVAYLLHPPSADYWLRGSSFDGEYPAKDLGIEVEYEFLASESSLHLVLRKGQSTFLAVLSNLGRELRILRQDATSDEPSILMEVSFDSTKSRGRAFFTLADQVITFTLDDQVLVDALPYPAPTKHSISELPPDFSHFEQAGVGGVGPLLVGRIRLGRDILYRSTGTYGVAEAFQLADGQYFLLGDNPAQSRDSRQYGAVPSERILGTVSSRVWPRDWTERGWPVE